MSVDVAFKVDYDGQSLAQLSNFMGFDQHMNELLDDLCEEFGKAGVAFIKPEVRGNNYWQPSTGDTERGIAYEVEAKGGDSRTVYFLGNHMADDGVHNVAHMLDVGNFDKDEVMYAVDKGLRVFPIAGRLGKAERFLPFIHGAGHTTHEHPNFFSDRAVTHLADNVPNLAERHMQAFLDRLVI